MIHFSTLYNISKATIYKTKFFDYILYYKSFNHGRGLHHFLPLNGLTSVKPQTPVLSCIFFRRSFNCTNNTKYEIKKETTVHLKTVKRRELLQDAFEKKRDKFIEKKNVLVTDIRKTKSKVQEKVREKIEEINEKENILTIPNALTISRGILSPYIGYVIVQGDYTLAMGLLVVAGISDLLDGQIARYWPQQASKFGSFMDPMADKLLVGSLVISMGYCHLLPVWLAGMILFRDIFLIGAGFVIRYISLPPPKTFTRYFDATTVTAELQPTFISKVNTAVQLGTIGLSLGAPIWQYIDHIALHGLWYLTGITTAAAAISYITNKNTYKILKKQSKFMNKKPSS